MFRYALKVSLSSVFLFSLCFATPNHLAAQSPNQYCGDASSTPAQEVPGQTEKMPQPGDLGSPFSIDHPWKHIALELSGGYTPVVSKGARYFNNGFDVTAGVTDPLSARWIVLGEVNIFGLRGSGTVSSGSSNFGVHYSNTVASFGGAAIFDFVPRARTSPYAIGGVGYYLLVPVTMSGAVSNLTQVDSENSVGYNGGIGVRHRLYDGKRMEIFAEGRYHYIASGSTAFGQMSLLPVSAGIRW